MSFGAHFPSTRNKEQKSEVFFFHLMGRDDFYYRAHNILSDCCTLLNRLRRNGTGKAVLKWENHHFFMVQFSSVQFSLVQDGIYALGKAHTIMRSTPSLKEFYPMFAFETVPGTYRSFSMELI